MPRPLLILTLALVAGGSLWFVLPGVPAPAALARLRLPLAGLPTATPPPSCARWAAVPSPSRTGTNYLHSVAALAPDNVWAVGEKAGVPLQPLTAHWNGGQWTLVPNPSGGALHGVAAAGPTAVWAVGYTASGSLRQTLIERWDGSAWTVVPSPNVGPGRNTLTALAAPGPTDLWAVGSAYSSTTTHDQTLILHSDGTTWTVVPSPNGTAGDNYLLGVAFGTPSDGWAVGYTLTNNLVQTLALHWDGTTWTVVPSPNPGTSTRLLGVAVAGPNDVWAVGVADGPTVNEALLAHWTGSSWTVVPSPVTGHTISILNGVTALSPTDLWAVGYYDPVSAFVPLMLHSDGTGWRVVAAPSVGGSDNQPEAVAGANTRDVWAVGEVFVPLAGAFQTLTEHYTDSCLTPTPPPVVSPSPTPSPAATGTGIVRPSPTTTGTSEPSRTATATPAGCLTIPGAIAPTDPTFQRPSSFFQGGSCSVVGSWPAVHYDVYELQVSSPGPLLASLCAASGGAATFDSFLALYQAPGGGPLPGFVPDGCPLAVVANDDTCAAASQVQASVAAGYVYLVVTQYSPDPAFCTGPCYGTYTLAVRGAAGCPIATVTPTITPTPTVTRTPTQTPTRTLSPTPTECRITFVDVPPANPFYDFIRCLACRGIVGGYPCGAGGEPCPGTYFRPNNNVTRGQVSKIVSTSAALTGPIPSTQQTFEDVAPASTFWPWVEQLSSRGIIGGYPCGGAGEPCVAPTNRPYFRPNNAVTRGQLSKITSGAANWTETPTGQTFQDVPVSSTFYIYVERVAVRGIVGGYPCGGAGEPCVVPTNRPYFRPSSNATRGQMSKIAAAAFFPGCNTPSRR